MSAVKVSLEVEAVQFASYDDPLPDGCFWCHPEVHWSAARDAVYFTYADLRCTQWISAQKLPMPMPEKFSGFEGGLRIYKKDGETYWRKVYPFAFYDIKSESQIKRDHKAVYLNDEDPAELDAFIDYYRAEGWPEPITPMIEYRIANGAYGRGFKPVYLALGDWLLKGGGQDPRKMTNAEFEKVRLS